MYLLRAIAAAAAVPLLLASGNSALGAIVDGAEGAITINRGDGFVSAQASSNVQPGGLIMIAPGQSAVITYPDGCRVKVGAGRVWAIEAVSPCPPGQPEIDYTSLGSETQVTNITTGQIADPGAPGAPGAGGGSGGPGTGGGFPGGTLGLAAGGAAIAIAVGVGLAVSKSNKSSSP